MTIIRSIFIVLISCTLLQAQNDVKVDYTSYLQSMTLEEKIGQLFMVRSSTKYDINEKKED